MARYLALVRGTDFQLDIRPQEIGQAAGDWIELPGSVQVLAWKAGLSGDRVDIYAVGADFALHHWSSADGGLSWSQPENLGGIATSDLTLIGPLA